MSRSNELINLVDRYGAHNYLPLPIVLSKGSGSYVWDVEGKKYLDFLSCYSALNFGHSAPRLVKALTEQASKLALCSRAFHSEELCLFSKELAEFAGLEMVLPMNSGAEAVESALKVARKWGYKKRGVKSDRAKILTFENNFHGRTITIVSFSSEPDYRDGFGPFTPGFTQVPFDDLDAVEKHLDGETVAVLVEPVQAEAGILVPQRGFLKGLRDICTRNKTLLILDEIQTGLGRTGRDFCFQHEDIKPDLLVLGKSLGGGLLPVSALVGTREVLETLEPGQHGSTFGGNPLAAAVAREAIKILREDKLSERAMRLGETMLKILKAKPLPKVKEIRALGALVGIELDASSGGARPYCEDLAKKGVLCKETHTYVIRLAPPLVISDADLHLGTEAVVQTILSRA